MPEKKNLEIFFTYTLISPQAGEVLGECFFMIAQMACDWSLYYVPLEPSNNYYASNKSFFFEFIFCDSSKFLKYADIIFLGPANSSHTF